MTTNFYCKLLDANSKNLFASHVTTVRVSKYTLLPRLLDGIVRDQIVLNSFIINFKIVANKVITAIQKLEYFLYKNVNDFATKAVLEIRSQWIGSS